MDLSTKAKRKRDDVEIPLFNISSLLGDIDEVERRIHATIKVYPETSRALAPALSRLSEVRSRFGHLKKHLAVLWRKGSEKFWK